MDLISVRFQRMMDLSSIESPPGGSPPWNGMLSNLSQQDELNVAFDNGDVVGAQDFSANELTAQHLAISQNRVRFLQQELEDLQIMMEDYRTYLFWKHFEVDFVKAHVIYNGHHRACTCTGCDAMFRGHIQFSEHRDSFYQTIVSERSQGLCLYVQSLEEVLERLAQQYPILHHQRDLYVSSEILGFVNFHELRRHSLAGPVAIAMVHWMYYLKFQHDPSPNQIQNLIQFMSVPRA